VEEAKSGRAKCKQCGESIPKGDSKVGVCRFFGWVDRN